MQHSHDIVIRPVLTEKSYGGMSDKVYTFIVDRKASKTEVKQSVEKIFGVKVERVNTVNSLGKVKRQGAHEGRRPSTKKAYVKLKKDSKGIEFFDGIVQ